MAGYTATKDLLEFIDSDVGIFLWIWKLLANGNEMKTYKDEFLFIVSQVECRVEWVLGNTLDHMSSRVP